MLRRHRPEHFASAVGVDGSSLDDDASDEGSWADGGRYTDRSYKHYRFDSASCPPRRLGPLRLVPEFFARSELSSVLRDAGLGPSGFRSDALRGEIAEPCGIGKGELNDVRHGDSHGRAQWAIRSGKVALYYTPTLRVSMPAVAKAVPEELTESAPVQYAGPVEMPEEWVHVDFSELRHQGLSRAPAAGRIDGKWVYVFWGD